MRPWLPIEAIYTVAFVTIAYFVGYRVGYRQAKQDQQEERGRK